MRRYVHAHVLRVHGHYGLLLCFLERKGKGGGGGGGGREGGREGREGGEGGREGGKKEGSDERKMQNKRKEGGRTRAGGKRRKGKVREEEKQECMTSHPLSKENGCLLFNSLKPNKTTIRRILRKQTRCAMDPVFQVY